MTEQRVKWSGFPPVPIHIGR